MSEGKTVAEAAWSTLLGYEFELGHASSNLVVLGAPHMTHKPKDAKGSKGKK